MRRNVVLAVAGLVVGIVMFPVGEARAEQGAVGVQTQQEDPDLRGRVRKLEQIVEDLRGVVGRQSSELTGMREAQKRDLNDMRRLLDKDAGGKSGNWLEVAAGLNVQLYGYIKADAAWDSARTDVGNFARWVESEAGRNKDSQFNVTARQTRLGLKINGPEGNGAKASGIVEIDFFGGTSENKPEPMMRHAYLKIDWEKIGFSVLAGQTWDVISPLNPYTLNYSVGWWAGNLGYRRPQIRVTQLLNLGEGVDLKLEAAVARTIGRDNGLFDPGDTGEDACLPGIQGRAAVTFPLLAAGPTTVGLSSHFAQEEYDTDASDHGVTLDSWSANLDVTQPINGWISIKGELFTGENMDAYLGGIGQGVNTATLEEIGTCGGWAAASLSPWDRWRFNLGAGVEAINAKDVTSASARTVNRMVFGNAIYEILPNASVGFEISHWHTEYKARDDGDSLRLQTSFLYKF